MQPTGKMDPSQRVRYLWTEFEVWAAQKRTRLVQECAGLDEKWRHKSSWTNNKQQSQSTNDLQRQKEIRDAQERYKAAVRAEWDRRLTTHKLRDTDWGFIAEQEADRISIVMGEDLEEPTSLAVAMVPTPPQPQLQRAQQPASATQAPPAPSRPAPAPIQPVAPQLNGPPSAGPSSRSANTSSSSYTFVDPADFTTDDELIEHGSSYVIPTDESEDDSISISNPELWGIPTQPHRGRSSNHSSQSASPDYPNTNAFDLHPSAFSKPDLQTTSPKRPPPEIDKPSPVKPRVRGPSYIGPRLHDGDDKSEEELDFEKFKMYTRITKIWEFHFAAAQADVELAMSIYNDRQTKKVTGAKSDDASRIAAHEKNMLRLQAQKEGERKALVSEERKRRREAIKSRRTLGEPSNNANHADPTSASKSWGDFFDAESTHIAFDANGRLIHSKQIPAEEQEEVEEEEDGEDEEEDDQDFLPAPRSANRGQFGTLKASNASKLILSDPPGRAAPSGWKKKSTLASSPWDPAPSAPAKSNNPFANSHPSPLAQDSAWGNEFSEDPQSPGHFSDESPTTPTLGSWASWGSASANNGKKPAVPSKLAQVQSAPSPPRSQAEQNVHDLSFDAPASTPIAHVGKKMTAAAKKRLAATQSEAHSAAAVASLAKVEAETKMPTMTARVPDNVINPKDLLHQKWVMNAEEELSSTPRPSLLNGSMKRGLANGISAHSQAHDYMSESVLTPRVGMRRLDSSVHASSVTDNETPWQRQQRLTKGGQTAMKQIAQQPFDEDDDEEESSIWSRGIKQPQAQPMARVAKTAPTIVQQQQPDDESIWRQVMKSKVQAQTSIPQAIANVNIAEMEDQARIWDQMKRQKAPAVEKPMNGLRSVPQPQATQSNDIVDGETPWQRMQRLSAMAANVASTNPPPAAAPMQHSWGPTNDYEAPSFRHPQPQPPSTFENGDQYWSPNAQASTSRAQQSTWSTPGHNRNGTSHAMKNHMNGRRVMIEDVQDEEDADMWNTPGSTLPSDSTMVLDIAIPRPSKPSMVYDNIIGYGEDGEEEEDGYNTGLSSSVPTPSTAPTSPPNEVPTMDDDWFASVAQDMKNGNFDGALERVRRDDHLTSNPVPIPASKQKPKSAWGAGAQSKESSSFSQNFDSAKLRSALEQVSSTPTTFAPSPPKAASTKAAPASTITAPPPAPPAKAAENAPEAPEKKEAPAAKPAPAPAKGKGKKGKGRK